MGYLVIIFASTVVELFLFSLAAGEDDGGSAENQDSANDVEDRGTDAAGGGVEGTTQKATPTNLIEVILFFLRACTVLLRFLPIR